MEDNAGPSQNVEEFAPVSGSEDGQKLLRFLERRLDLPQALLHRWIRTGQIRVNGKRCKPFVRVNQGDIVRLPPFALTLPGPCRDELTNWSQEQIKDALGTVGLQPAAMAGNIIALEKPAGLPAQGGSGHLDSVAARLKQCFANCMYIPGPAHRLDRDTTGLLLVGATHESQRQLHEACMNGQLVKEYLALSAGRWPFNEVKLASHYLLRAGEKGREKAVVFTEAVAGGKPALSLIKPLAISDDASLLQVRLLTGRYNQIRAQLASYGFPVCGDGKYGAFDAGGLKLHAFRIILPDGTEFLSKPSWLPKDQELPAPLAKPEIAQ